MLKKYRTIIYESEDEINKVIDNCINRVLKNHPECTKEEILESIIKNKSDILNYDFTNELLMTEGKMLFDIAAAKFGEKIWGSNVKLDNTCKKLCPFGDMCNQYFVEIEGEHICYGQMLQMQINMKSLQMIAIEKQVKIIKPNGEIFIDLSFPEYDEQLLADYFFQYEWFIMRFGEDCKYGKHKVNGNNVISHL